MIETARGRALLGASAALWAGVEGVRVHDAGWSAISGVSSVDYNVVFCSGGRSDVDAGVELIAAAGVPAVLMVAGTALGEVQTLVQRSWVCIGSSPMMALDLDAVPAAPGSSTARRLADDEVDSARELVAEVFEVGEELSRVAIPPGIRDRAGMAVWGAHDATGRLVSCLAAVREQEAIAIWSMATAQQARGQGHGRRLLEATLAAAATDGATSSILYSSAAGEPFYRATGYRELERWQMWSRPRWVLGRA